MANRKETRAVEVEIGVKVLAMETVQLGGPLAGYMLKAQMLAHDGAILGLSQGIVIGVPRSRLGQFDA